MLNSVAFISLSFNKIKIYILLNVRKSRTENSTSIIIILILLLYNIQWMKYCRTYHLCFLKKSWNFFRKGEEIQKLSVIQNLPSLLATDTQSCMSRVVPKMQQSLATASTEFHIAASSTFKTILEQKLVSHNVFSQTFLQSILNSLESRDPGKHI